MQKTENYHLCQWEARDSLRREEFNADNAAIDAAIQAVAETAAGKASTESVAAVSESVAALSTQVAACGNCVITSGSYTATGAAKTLSFDFKPLVVFLSADAYDYDDIATLVRSATAYHSCFGEKVINVTWTDESVTFGNGSDYFTKSKAATKYVAIGQRV